MMAAAIPSSAESGWPSRRFFQASIRKRRASARDGLNIALSARRSSLRLGSVFAKIANDALGAAGLSGDADVAPVQDEPMMRVQLELVRHELLELALHLFRRRARRDARPVRH